MEIRIYFEGNDALRPGFRDFFSGLHELARQNKITLRLIAAKNGPNDFKKALRSHPDSFNILLKDCEQPFTNPVALCHRHDIDAKLSERVFWMVELMESWFLADPDTLAKYYGQGFSRKVIGQTGDVEAVPKNEVFNRLKSATANTTKGEYSKVRHAPDLLAKLDPKLVQKHAEHCRVLFEALQKMIMA